MRSSVFLTELPAEKHLRLQIFADYLKPNFMHLIHFLDYRKQIIMIVFQQGQFASTRDQFVNNLKATGVDINRFEIVEGFFNSSLKNYQGAEKISIAWIDCDLYEST